MRRAIRRSALVVGGLAILVGGFIYGSIRFAESAAKPQGTGAADARDGSSVGRRAVVCLGRLEPGEGVIDIGAAARERVVRLEVEEGQTVGAGEVLATLESWTERRSDRDVQRALVEEARLRLRKAREFGPLEVQAQEANVRRLETELALAHSDLERTRALIRENVVTEQAYEHQQTVTARAQETLEHARIVLEKERHAQLLAVAEAEAQLATAQARLVVAEARLERAAVRAPIRGQILKIFAWPGEPVGAGPILQMGDTEHMYAVAEVYETDVRFVEVGQRATVTSPALGRELTGTVQRIGAMIHKNDVLGVDPAADTDARVIEVRIRLEDGELATKFNHLQVDVAIDVEPADRRRVAEGEGH